MWCAGEFDNKKYNFSPPPTHYGTNFHLSSKWCLRWKNNGVWCIIVTMRAWKASLMSTFMVKPNATADIAGRSGLLPTVLIAFTIHNTKCIWQPVMCPRKVTVKENILKRRMPLDTFFIHKMNMLTRFDSSVVSKSSCVSHAFGFYRDF